MDKFWLERICNILADVYVLLGIISLDLLQQHAIKLNILMRHGQNTNLKYNYPFFSSITFVNSKLFKASEKSI